MTVTGVPMALSPRQDVEIGSLSVSVTAVDALERMLARLDVALPPPSPGVLARRGSCSREPSPRGAREGTLPLLWPAPAASRGLDETLRHGAL